MVEVLDLCKHFLAEKGVVRALEGVSFDVPEGTLLTLLGPSGCGKTTTLRCIAGLERPEKGTIRIGGRTVFSGSSREFVPPEQRRIGMVFQSYAIWPHMTVFENVAYPWGGRGLSRTEIAERVTSVLGTVGLAELANRPAPNLSGGQQQRVALARALVAEPAVLLLDEPLSNLDVKLRQQMRTEIRYLQRQTGITAVYVTHDQEEALAVSDEIVFMSEGRLVERGRPEDLYLRPRERATAAFLGDANFVPGRVTGSAGEALVVETLGGTLLCTGEASRDATVSVFFRPESAQVERARPRGGYFLRGTIRETLFLGKTVNCGLQLGDGQRLQVTVSLGFGPRVGEEVYLLLDPGATRVFASRPGESAPLPDRIAVDAD